MALRAAAAAAGPAAAAWSAGVLLLRAACCGWQDGGVSLGRSPGASPTINFGPWQLELQWALPRCECAAVQGCTH